MNNKHLTFEERSIIENALLKSDILILPNGLCGFGIYDTTAICYEKLLFTVVFC